MITVKEEFVGCDKYERAIALGGSDTIVMWLAMKRYCAQHLTDGIVPDEDIDKLPGAPKHPRKALKHLVGCGRLKNGVRGAGLVDPGEGFWSLHDYEDHANSSTEEELRKEKERERKRKWRAEKERELELLKAGQLNGTGRDIVPGPNGTDGRDRTGSRPGTKPASETGPRPQASARPSAPAPARVPNPTQPTPTLPVTSEAEDPKDLTGSAREEAEAATTAETPVEEKVPRNLAEALKEPICIRAQFITERKVSAEWIEPHKWPEIQALNQVFVTATGHPRPLDQYHRDKGVQVLVALFAVGYLQRDLARGIELAVRSEWWTRDGDTRGLGSFSVEVIDRALREGSKATPSASSSASRFADVTVAAVTVPE